MDAAAVAQVAIRALLARYVACIDQARAAELALLFAEGGILESRITGRQNLGRAAIEAYLAQVIGSRTRPEWARIQHHLAPPDVEVVDAGHGRSRCYFTAFTTQGVDHWGMYADEFVQVGGSWLFARRSVSMLGATPGGWVDSGSAALPAGG